MSPSLDDFQRRPELCRAGDELECPRSCSSFSARTRGSRSYGAAPGHFCWELRTQLPFCL